MRVANWHEQPLAFECEGSRLIGIVTHPSKPTETGVVIVVGGPQYRAGSHRQFTLLARQLAENSIASIRFDYRGMGDSEGEMRNFENVDADIRAAIDILLQQVSAVRRVALWGLCDAASAALYYGHADDRVNKLILLNPWVHTPAGASRARLKHYYLRRLLSRSFWNKLLSGNIKLGETTRDIASTAKHSMPKNDAPADPRHGSSGYIERMFQGLKGFQKEVLFVLSENDLVAHEFSNLLQSDKRWKSACTSKLATLETIAHADHTFSSNQLRSIVCDRTAKWLCKKETT